MTIGTKTVDNTQSITVTDTTSGSHQITVGDISNKSWSGIDYPVGSRSKIGRPFEFFTSKPGLRRSFARPPKRSSVVEHPYSVTAFKRHHVMNTQLGVCVTPNSTSITSTISYAGPSGISYNWSTNDDLAMIGKLRERVAGSDFNAGVFLGEGHQSLKTIADAAFRIRNAILDLRRGNIYQAARALSSTRPPQGGVSLRKSTSSNWLELQYGWLPLLQDCESAAKFLAHHFSVPLQHVVRVSREQSGGHIDNKSGGISLTNQRLYTRVSIKAVLKEKDVVALSGLLDPLSVIWETLPYSFVIDWFIPIGNFLQARGLAQSLTGTFVTSKKQYASYSGCSIDSPNPCFRNPDLSGCSGEDVTFTRTVSSSLAIPLPSVKPLNQVTSWKHCANAVALLLQLKR